MKVRRYLS